MHKRRTEWMRVGFVERFDVKESPQANLHLHAHLVAQANFSVVILNLASDVDKAIIADSTVNFYY